jgi:hypothetical protein
MNPRMPSSTDYGYGYPNAQRDRSGVGSRTVTDSSGCKVWTTKNRARASTLTRREPRFFQCAGGEPARV